LIAQSKCYGDVLQINGYNCRSCTNLNL